MEQQPDFQGKKIFLLYPHDVIRDDMLDILIMEGYETYTLVDVKRARKLLVKFPDSIMFINIDEGLEEKIWEAYIRGIQEDPALKNSRLGIMSYNQDRVLMQKYLMELAIPCGYVQLKLGVQESTKIMLGVLEANEARGRRKCIRVDCQDDTGSTLNYEGNSGTSHGNILDISSTGIAVKFEKPDDHAINSIIRNVQLKLRDALVMTDMTCMGQRHDDKQVYILLFDSNMPTKDKLVIHHYIKQCLQKYIDGLKV